MAVHVYGKITVATAGTLVQIDTDNLGRRLSQMTVNAASTNTGKLWVGTSAMNKSTGAGVLAELAPGGAATIPGYGSSMTAEKLWLDGDTNGNAGYCSGTVL